MWEWVCEWVNVRVSECVSEWVSGVSVWVSEEFTIFTAYHTVTTCTTIESAKWLTIQLQQFPRLCYGILKWERVILTQEKNILFSRLHWCLCICYHSTFIISTFIPGGTNHKGFFSFCVIFHPIKVPCVWINSFWGGIITC